MKNSRQLALRAVLALLAAPSLLFAWPNPAAAHPRPSDVTFISLENSSPFDPSEDVPKVSIEKSGTLPTKEGMLLRVNTDPGNIHVFTDESTRVSYCVRVEADSREPGAKEFLQQFTVVARPTPSGISLEGSLPWRTFHAQFGVSYEIHIPRRYNIEVHTAGGNIELQDIEGRAELFSEGGNITAGRVDTGVASPHSSHSSANRIAAKLETLGGHISVGDVAGTLQATTSGGHITVGNIDGDGILRTGGGQIQTGRISGMATLDTGGGDITAWLNEASDHVATEIKSGIKANIKHVHKSHGECQLSSDDGDVVVYIPRKMAATIDAVVDRDGGHRIIADASLPLKINDEDSGTDPRTIHITGTMNGGGEVLRIKAVSGNIILRPGESRSHFNTASSASWMETGADSHGFQPPNSPSTWDEPGDFDDAAGFFAEMRRRILESWWGGVPVDASELQKHIEHSVAPVYPDVARRAGVEGDVVLRVRVSSDGRVTDLRVLDGPPILARAAVEAVQQWQYQALQINGQPAAVVTTLIVSFRLH